MENPLKLYFYLCIALTMASLCTAEDLSQKTIRLENKCSFTVWPGIASFNTHEYDTPDGFKPVLNSGESYSITFPMQWEGLIWGRTGCSFDSSEAGSCYSGDCGGFLRCEKAPLNQKISTPITQVLLQNGTSAVDVEEGYNLPLSIKSCGSLGCSATVADVCPTNIQIKVNNEVVSCNGGCNVYQGTCSPPEFSNALKETCPNVFPFKNKLWCPTTTSYILTFCPSQ
ncbi:hypothetical protein SUGI_0775780 [Cryptomeria japonica]|uniref:pathogenesis-related thaumatin-like protein 3.5 isoform X1 n=1 Tax=Cryptomeria japonica TaxID=3369 RepID=UPI00241484CB|nr:pathogenesis-related thaumatin-like protein 3.5 isoform X1 [Cryptomeria japonica]GLJ38108.1 hypothetical protein SUGI_0775780 [Cryptomeria japonica]